MKKVRIEIKGELNKEWAENFNNMTFRYEGSNTVLTGQVEDQSAFHGIMNRIRDLNLTLVSICSEYQESN